MGGHLQVITLCFVCVLTYGMELNNTIETISIDKGECADTVNITKEECIHLKFYSTTLPSVHLGCSDMDCLDKVFTKLTLACGLENDAIFYNDFLCSFVYPRCHNNKVILPCRKYCRDSLFRCRHLDDVMSVCEDLPEETDETNVCVKKGRRGPTAPPVYCSADTHRVCSEMGFSSCHVVGNGSSPSHGNVDQENKDGQSTYFDIFSIIKTCRDPLVTFYVCGHHLPISTEIDQAVYPCGEYCVEVIRRCPEIRRYVGEDMCWSLVTRLPRLGSLYCLDPPFSTITSVKRQRITVVKRESFAPRGRPLDGKPQCHFCGCEPFWQTECLALGYRETILNNAWSPDKETSRKKFQLAIPAIASGCSPDILLYVCTQLFPVCVTYGKTRTACRSVCEDVNQNCSSYLNRQDCSDLPETDCLTSSLTEEVCNSTQIQCANTKKCVPESSVCDNINDCGDWSDERNCTCNSTNQWRCKSGMCIPRTGRCNQVFDCPDESDEDEYCGCNKNDFRCEPDKTCTMYQWYCDGQNDCASGDDELVCTWCDNTTEWKCVNTECVPYAKRCDGKPDCMDHSDEIGCMSQNKDFGTLLVANIRYDVMMSVCYGNFSVGYGQIACKKLGHGDLQKYWPVQSPVTQVKYELQTNGGGKVVRRCPNNTVVAMECKQKGCGHSRKNVPRVTMETAQAGQWPWVVYIGVTRDRSLICGGGILNEYVILTSAHCVQRIKNLNEIEIGAGSHIFNLVDTRPNQRRYQAESTIIHPKFDPAENYSQYDIALILLKERIEFNDDTKPLCLPDKADVFSKANDCFLAGWGQIFCDNSKTRLRQRRLTLWEIPFCNMDTMYNGSMTPNERCAEFYKGFEDVGPGDNGSPIFCSDTSGTFKFVGVAPSTHSEYMKRTEPPAGECELTRKFRFASVQKYLDWIINKTACVFRCNNGNCIVQRSRLCDNVDDCGDSSDEAVNCGPVSFNCSFDEPFLCGYKMFGDNWRHLTNGVRLSNHYPMFDHTVGKYPGQWISIEPYSYMKSPMINVTGPHCVRFHYFFRGRPTLGTAVYYNNGTHMKQVADYKAKKGIGKWYMGLFDIEPGPLQMIVRTYDGYFSIDDIWLLEGTCETHKCFKNEYMCRTEGLPNCLPSSTRCNVVADCDENFDENCKRRYFTCNFENGNTCGFVQSDDDSPVNEWRLVNSSMTINNTRDRTFRSLSGTLLSVNLTNWNSGDELVMKQKLFLNHLMHCLRFSFLSTTPLSLSIYTLKDGKKSFHLEMENPWSGWRKAHFKLYNISRRTATLFYSVKNVKGNTSVDNELLFDNVVIERGRCPCDKGWLMCRNEDKCVMNSKICDRIVDCRAGTDEKKCNCTSDELRCQSGMCVPKAKLCNGRKDCREGLDETIACDKSQNVTCNFESVFLCGYTIIPEPGPGIWGWDRLNERLDRTEGFVSEYKANGTGFTNDFYMGAKLTRGTSQSTLISVPFSSFGNVVRFSLFLFDLEGHLAYLQENIFQLWYRTTNGTTGDTTEKLLWETFPTRDFSWRNHCVALPNFEMIRIHFKVAVKELGKIIAGLDDVKLLTSRC